MLLFVWLSTSQDIDVNKIILSDYMQVSAKLQLAVNYLTSLTSHLSQTFKRVALTYPALKLCYNLEFTKLIFIS